MGWELQGSHGPEAPPEAAGGLGESERSVLVVAQDFSTRQSLISVLASAEVGAFGSGPSEALAMETLYNPSVALIEHRSAGGDGLSIATRMKERQTGMQVLLLTDPSSLESARPSPYVDDYLVKPLVTAQFIQTVRNALARSTVAAPAPSPAPRPAPASVVPEPVSVVPEAPAVAPEPPGAWMTPEPAGTGGSFGGAPPAQEPGTFGAPPGGIPAAAAAWSPEQGNFGAPAGAPAPAWDAPPVQPQSFAAPAEDLSAPAGAAVVAEAAQTAERAAPAPAVQRPSQGAHLAKGARLDEQELSPPERATTEAPRGAHFRRESIEPAPVAPIQHRPRRSEGTERLASARSERSSTGTSAGTDGLVEGPHIEVDDRLASVLTAPPERLSTGVFLVEVRSVSGQPNLFVHPRREEILSRAEAQLSASRRRTDRVTAAGEGRFVVVCSDVDSASTAESIAAGISDEVSSPMSIGGEEISLEASLGVVLQDPEAAGGPQPPDELMEDASLALRVALEEGRPWVVFDGGVGDGVRLRERLRKAMDNGELRLEFQRIVSLDTHEVVGAEAFLRWARPGRGVLPAAAFLDGARESGMAVPLGRWVIDHALSELSSWRARTALPETFRLFVNVSAEEVLEPSFSELLEKLLRDHGVPPAMLTLDMAETAIGDAADIPAAVQGLRALGELGVACVVDDYGTGRSKLDWLQELPVTGLKITPELVGALDGPDERRGPALVRGVIALGHELQLKVMGEGVESRSQEAALRAMGCDLAQGFHLGRPESGDEMAAALVH